MQNATNITQLLQDWSNGKKEVLEKLMPLVYDELRRQASRFLRNERKHHTLQTTALIHEAYLKLIGQKQVEWQNRNHFFAIASVAPRCLVSCVSFGLFIIRGNLAFNLFLTQRRKGAKFKNHFIFNFCFLLFSKTLLRLKLFASLR